MKHNSKNKMVFSIEKNRQGKAVMVATDARGVKYTIDKDLFIKTVESSKERGCK